MSTGQMLFYGGIALLGVTVLLAIFFLVKKPRYTPESAFGRDGEIPGTQKLQNAYPTAPATASQRDGRSSAATHTEKLLETALLDREEGEGQQRRTALLEDAPSPPTEEQPFRDGQ